MAGLQIRPEPKDRKGARVRGTINVESGQAGTSYDKLKKSIGKPIGKGR